MDGAITAESSDLHLSKTIAEVTICDAPSTDDGCGDHYEPAVSIAASRSGSYLDDEFKETYDDAIDSEESDDLSDTSVKPRLDQHAMDWDIYPDLSFRLSVIDYSPEWPRQFASIKEDLLKDLHEGRVSCPFTIEHVGSTSVPGLACKALTDPRRGIIEEAIVDICIVLSREDFAQEKLHLEQISDALAWGSAQGGYRYVGDGGVADRWSFKLSGVLPLRNVYVVAEDGLPLRQYRSLRDVLRQPEYQDLLHEYAAVKRELCADEEAATHPRVYCHGKSGVIREIYKVDGWTDGEMDEAHERAKRNWEKPSTVEIWEEELAGLMGDASDDAET